MRQPPVFKKIKESVLGKRYDLSVAFLSLAEMRSITRKTKKKNRVSNVLAFPLSKTSGEILLCPKAAKPWSLEYLFIHACLHLKGFRHSATMEHEERRILKKFGLGVNE
jgi:ssRNA-specific RNase YbeY (16S rRNA maturation enzyme)